MAKSRADKETELRLACEAAIAGADEKVLVAIRAGSFDGMSSNLARRMAKPRVLAVSALETSQHASAFIRVFEHSTAGIVKPMKVFRLKHLSKVEVLTNDPSGCSFLLGFDNVRHQSVSSSQWTTYNVDDRNLFLLSILKTCKDMAGRIPRVFGIDIVQMALWLKEREATSSNQESSQDDPMTTMISEGDLKVTVQNELSSQAEEEDMQALLDFYVIGIGEAEAFSEMLKRELHALEAANVHDILELEPLVDEVLQGLDTALNYTCEMDEWLSTFNVKLKFMRDDIEFVEALNNSLEFQSDNGKALDEELSQLLEKLDIPSEHAACLTKGSFNDANMPKIMEACEWLNSALTGLEVPKLDPAYSNMRAVRVKRVELKKLKSTFVGRASDFLRNYLTSLVDHMIRDKHQRSTSPDHSNLHTKCRAYTGLLLHLKQFDKNCLGPLRKAYCTSFNLLLRRESRDFANELRSSTKLSRNTISWFDASADSGQSARNPDTSAVSDAYAKMLTNFIPHLELETRFFAQFMCFDISTPSGKRPVSDPNEANEKDKDIMEVNNNGVKDELALQSEFVQELLDGVQEDFYAIVEWGNKIDPLRCIAMHEITVQSISAQKPDASKPVLILLSDLQSRSAILFTRFVEEFCHRIDITQQNSPPAGLHLYVPRFATLATCMELCIQGQARDLVDKAYSKIGNTLFTTLNKMAKGDSKYGDLFILENCASFQTSLYDLANMVPALAKLYNQASDAYEKACTRHVHMIVYSQFQQLFQYARRIEELMTTNKPEEIRSKPGMSATDLERVLRASSNGIEKSINAMYKGLQRNLTIRELILPLHMRCKKEFISMYQAAVELIGKVYPDEIKCMPTVPQVRELLASIEEAYFL